MSKKILVADDQRELVEAMVARFENAGYEVVAAYDGEECLEKIKIQCPDLIVLDVTMPKMDGFSVVRAVKEDERVKNTPIIMVTGKDQMEDIFRMEGVREYVVKPFEYKDLLAMVVRLIG